MDEDNGKNILEYVVLNGQDQSFTKHFWKSCEPHPYEVRRYPLYAECLRLFVEGESIASIARQVGVNSTTVKSWVTFKKKPKLAHYLSIYLKLGEPRPGWVWLSVNNSSGHAVPLGPVVQVPTELSEWSEVETLLGQLEPVGSVRADVSLQYKFGFLLGLLIGDAGKKRQKAWHRHIELVMSKKYATNVLIGDFLVDCARSVGLRMKRMPDSAPRNKPNSFFVWESQSSGLVDWLFNVCLGLRDNELTTYNAVRMRWALDGPLDFRQGLVQGLNESDGSVNISGQEVDLWVGPSNDFARSLLKTFGVRSFDNRDALSISKSQVAKAFAVPIFSPILKTVRYIKLEKLAMANHISRGKRMPVEIRKRIIALASEGYTTHEISEMIVDEFRVSLTFEAVQRWASRKQSH